MRVIMFDIDTLRADHMGCYGYGRDTTPVMDSVGNRGYALTGIIVPTPRACPHVHP